MPPSSHTQLSKLEKTIIKNWIKSGAPNSSNCNTCDTTFKYASRVKPLMDKWCVGCHSNSNNYGHDLSNYAGVEASIATGKYLGAIQHTVGFPQMPKSAAKLSDCDINAIVKWVNAGAPNN
jgi:cytochrome c5